MQSTGLHTLTDLKSQQNENKNYNVHAIMQYFATVNASKFTKYSIFTFFKSVKTCLYWLPHHIHPTLLHCTLEKVGKVCEQCFAGEGGHILILF